MDQLVQTRPYMRYLLKEEDRDLLKGDFKCKSCKKRFEYEHDLVQHRKTARKCSGGIKSKRWLKRQRWRKRHARGRGVGK